MRRSLTTALVLVLGLPAAAMGPASTSAASRSAVGGHAASSSSYLGGLISPVVAQRNAKGGATPRANQSNITAEAKSGTMAVGAVAVLKLSGAALGKLSAGSTGSSGGSSVLIAINVSGLRPNSIHRVGFTNLCAVYNGISDGKGGQNAGHVSSLGPTATYCAGIYGGAGAANGSNSRSNLTAAALGSTCLSTVADTSAANKALPGVTPAKNATISLPNLHADAQGKVTLITQLPVDKMPDRGDELRIYADQSTHTAIGCAAIQPPTETITLNPMGNGATTTALAMLTSPTPVLNGQVKNGTQVIVVASGLQKNAAQPNHIHAGACGDGGPAVFPLFTLVSDSSGRGLAGTAIPFSGSFAGYSIEIHNTGYGMESCGNLVK
jgi:hypothetical protein